MREGLPEKLRPSIGRNPRRPRMSIYTGLDLSRKRLDWHACAGDGALVDAGAVPPDSDGLARLVHRLGGTDVLAVVEVMNGARFIHDQLELAGCDLVPEVWLPHPEVRAERERVRFRMHLVKHRTMLKNRIHQTLIAHGHARPTANLFTAKGRALLAGLELPEPWQGTVAASLALIEELDEQIDALERELRRLGADHHYVPLLCTIPGISWVLAYTIASEIGDITRFPSPRKLIGYTGLCPRVYQSGETDRRGALAKNGPDYLRWALVEAAHNAARQPAYRELAAHHRHRHGRPRGSNIAAITIARKLAEAIWWMLTRNQPYAPAGAKTV